MSRPSVLPALIAVPALMWSSGAAAQDTCRVDFGGDNCNVQVVDFPTDNLNHQSAYCGQSSYGGADDTWRIVPAVGEDVTVFLQDFDFFYADLDVFVTRLSCGSSTCVGYSDTSGVDHEIRFVGDGQPYYVHVDDYNDWGNNFYDMSIGCYGTCQSTDVRQAITCSTDIASSTVGGTDKLDYYRCGVPYNHLVQDNSEAIYSFVPQQSGSVTFRLSGMTTDHDLYVLQASCDPDSCSGSSTDLSTNTDSVTFNAVAGTTYYIVVEAFAGEGTYNLSFDAGPNGGCREDCNDGLDNDGDSLVDCADTADCSTDPVCACDVDADGYAKTGGLCGGNDCNDANNQVHPGRAEVCNGIDDNCVNGIDEGLGNTYYRDFDNDGYGNPSNSTTACSQPAGYVTNNTDCNDNNATITTPRTWYDNDDGDGYGDPNDTTSACSQPSGYLGNAGDCNDQNAAVNPSATEVCNGIDDNCVNGIDEGVKNSYYADTDNDSYGAGTATQACSAPSGYVAQAGDCGPSDNTVYPGAPELCDNKDNNCNGTADEGAKTTYYADTDADGYGVGGTTTQACSVPSGYASVAGDCAPTDNTVYPGRTEVCNLKDDNCVNGIDEGVQNTYYDDDDNDNFGDLAEPVLACTLPADAAPNSTDCRDDLANTYPGATEICDGIDNDCDGTVDDNATGVGTWYQDGDSDNYGNPSVTLQQCSQPQGYVANNTDCLDTNGNVNPGRAEVCNGIDDNCVNGIDESTATDAGTWYYDGDDDTYGNANNTLRACNQPADYVSRALDCDDTLASVNPAAAEVCNDRDDDCDGTVDESSATDASRWYADADSDTYGNANASQLACDQPAGHVANDDDCNDNPNAGGAAVHPNATEVCNDIDDNCVNGVDEAGAVGEQRWHQDADTDQYGNPNVSQMACDRPAGHVSDGTDCDDTRASVYPGAVEVPYDGIDQDCAAGDLVDVDGDGFPAETVGGTDCDDSDNTVHTGVIEVADGVDEDCDGTVDEGTDVYDDDGDGFSERGGDCDDAELSTSPVGHEEAPGVPCDEVDDDCDDVVDDNTDCFDDDGDGYTELTGDCNDGDADANPGLTEIDANGIDDDCDGGVDGAVYDPDGDGYTDAAGDCDQGSADTYPGASELPDQSDNDCDGTIDEGTEAYDDDGDGYSELYGDCDDGDVTANTDADEIADNGRDDDCDGDVDEGSTRTDDDHDGYSENGGDCDDYNGEVHPGGTEAQNGNDDDCDGLIDETWSDQDGDGYTSEDGDCDDQSGWVNPGWAEMCDEVDNNCNGEIDEGCGEDTGIVVEPPGKCGCDGGVGTAIGLGPWLGAALLLVRRRRAPAGR